MFGDFSTRLLPMTLLTTEQVAELLQVSERKVLELASPRTPTGAIRENPLPCCRLSERILRFDKDAVLKWVLAKR